MSDDKSKGTIPEPHSVVIPLEDRGEPSRDESNRSRKSSTSTSSFEDINNKGTETPRPLSRASFQSNKSRHSEYSRHSVHSIHSAEPATVDVGDIEMADSSQTVQTTSVPKGPSSFKTTSLDDPQFYAQTTSPTQSYTSRANIPGSNRKYGKKNDDRDPENVNDIVKVIHLLHLSAFY